MLPFKEEKIGDNIYIRTFDERDYEEFSWHRDREDRIIEPIGETDWGFQLDNELPMKLEKVFIPKGVYHRVIKGSGTLKIKLQKL